MDVSVEKEAEKLGVSVLADTMDGIIVGTSRKEVFNLFLEEIRTELGESMKGLNGLKNDPVIKALRSFYWRIGVDPTKTRPSSEALVRRIFRKGIPMINDLVDAGNLASARSFIPIGLYDLGMMEGEPRIVISEGGEIFRGIGGKDEILGPGIPVLVDDSGVMHLYPHRDSMRTRITEDTSDVLVVACGVKGIRRNNLLSALEYVDHYFSELGV